MFDQIKATDLFSNWAKEGKDQRMANTHEKIHKGINRIGSNAQIPCN